MYVSWGAPPRDDASCGEVDSRSSRDKRAPLVFRGKVTAHLPCNQRPTYFEMTADSIHASSTLVFLADRRLGIPMQARRGSPISMETIPFSDEISKRS